MIIGTRIYLSTRKGMITLEKTGNRWETAGVSFPGIPVSYAFKDPRTGTLWAALETDHYGSKLQRSLDDGATWTNIELPKYPEGAVAGDGSPASLSYIWVIAPGLPDHPERLYLGTEPGGLFQSDDGGETFSLVTGLWEHPTRMRGWFGAGRDYPGVHSIVIDPRNPDHVMVGISVAGVFGTVDGGKTWEPRNKGLNATYLPNPQAEVGQDPHLLLACPSDPNVLWQQNHCGIFRSTDSGQNWVEVSQPGGPAFFGFPIAVDAQDPESAWVVPAVSDEQRMAIDGALCVCRTEDGGKTWQELRAGLPQQDCYDVTYRHALDKHGDLLVFGTTSGNLFISEDRGDTWQSLSSHFPLIYAVRFG